MPDEGFSGILKGTVTHEDMQKKAIEHIQGTEYVSEFEVAERQYLLRYLCNLFAAIVLAMIGILLLAGFGLGGFKLEKEVTERIALALGVAVCGVIPAMLTVVVRYVYRSPRSKSDNEST